MSENADDIADTWDGRFWPAPVLRTDRPFDEIGSPYIAYVRHLPTRDALMRAAMAFGPGAHPVLGPWHAAWHRAVGDVDAFKANSPLAEPGRTSNPLRDATLMMPERPDLAASILAAARSVKAPQRDESFHILEDALVTRELLASGMPFVLVGAPLAPVPLVAAPDGAGGLRIVRWDGDASDQDLHASVGRRVRAHHESVNPYWESAVFRDAAGRGMAVARGGRHLAAMLRDMASDGHAKAFLKAVAQKGGTWVVDLAGVADTRSAALAAHAAMGDAYGTLHEGVASGRADLLVQGFVPFTHEHRFLVVDHRIVASTASDRGLSVLDAAKGRILHPAAARLARPASAAGPYDRGEQETVPDRGLVAAMARSARGLVADLRREGILPGCYCLDMGLTGGGVRPVEINTLVHCGLYGADWGRVARALARRRLSQPVEARRPTLVAGRDPLEDAVEFLLDMLSEEPPRRLREVAERLLQEGEKAEEAMRKGREARDRRRNEESSPFGPTEMAALAAMAKGPSRA